MTFEEAQIAYKDALLLQLQAELAIDEARENRKQADKNLSDAATNLGSVKALVENRYETLAIAFKQEHNETSNGVA